MCSKGHHLYGAEISQEVIKYNEERLKESGLKAHLVNLDSDVIPFPDGHFDAISAWHVLGYNNLDSLKTTTSEFHRVIKSGGRILGTIPAYGDVSHVSAKMLNSNEFVSNVSGQKGAHIICLETADDVSLALGWDANAIKIDLMQIPLLNGFVSRHWVFIYIKP
jgi:ubiquinone/menaquinone biosynthesis C-methylase UbiE